METNATVVNNAANATVVNNVTVKVTNIDIQKFEGQEYYTISFRLNKPIKKMVENDNGIYEDAKTSFISMPMSAFLASVNDDSINYYLSTKGVEVENVKTAFAGASLKIAQRKVAANETYKEFTNEKTHDVYFNELQSVKACKLAIVKIAAELGIEPSYLLEA